ADAPTGTNLVSTPAAPATSATPAAANTTPSSTSVSATPAAARALFVPVLLTATDAAGNPVSGMSLDKLTLIDNDHAVSPMKIFNGKDIPLHMAVVLVSDKGSFSQQQAAAADLVQKVIRPGVDQAFIVTAKGQKPWPSDHLEWS